MYLNLCFSDPLKKENEKELSVLEEQVRKHKQILWLVKFNSFSFVLLIVNFLIFLFSLPSFFFCIDIFELQLFFDIYFSIIIFVIARISLNINSRYELPATDASFFQQAKERVQALESKIEKLSVLEKNLTERTKQSIEENNKEPGEELSALREQLKVFECILNKRRIRVFCSIILIVNLVLVVGYNVFLL